jgi:hypothetical protein
MPSLRFRWAKRLVPVVLDCDILGTPILTIQKETKILQQWWGRLYSDGSIVPHLGEWKDIPIEEE